MKEELPPEPETKPQANVPPPRPPSGTRAVAGADDADRPRKDGIVQFKKETVRIDLPPLPSAAPRIQLAGVSVSAEAVAQKHTLWFPIAQQVVVLTVAAMILDGGETFQVAAYAALAYWGWFFLMFARRRKQLTRVDRMVLRWGFPVLLVVSSVITGLIWSWRGFRQ